MVTVLGALQEELKLASIPTGSRFLDEALCNGIRVGCITELVVSLSAVKSPSINKQFVVQGGSGSGKTQLSLQLVFNTIFPKPLGTIDGEAVFISTKRNFCPQRVTQLADLYVALWDKRLKKLPKNLETFYKERFTREKALTRILHKRVENAMELLSTVYYLKKMLLSNRNVS
jgi:RecA/RadA recombinase